MPLVERLYVCLTAVVVFHFGAMRLFNFLHVTEQRIHDVTFYICYICILNSQLLYKYFVTNSPYKITLCIKKIKGNMDILCVVLFLIQSKRNIVVQHAIAFRNFSLKME